MKWEIITARWRPRLLGAWAQAWYALGGDRHRLPGRQRYPEDCLIGQLRAVAPAANPAVKAAPLRVVFFTMDASQSYMSATDVAWGRALRLRGHQVSLVLCDQALPSCGNKQYDRRARWDGVCEKCYRRGLATFQASGLDYSTVSALVRAPFSAEEEALLKELDFSQIVQSSLFRVFCVGRLEDSEAVRKIEADVRRACEVSARAALAVARQRPDRVIMSHGVYSTWAPALAVFNRLGIPVAVHNKGKRRNSAVVNWTEGAMEWDVSSAWERVKELPLTSAQEERIQEYLGSRVLHKNDALRYNFGDVETREQFFERFHLNPAKPTFVLFTNVLWDASSAQKEIAFPNAVDWVMETIAWFREKPALQLVVKIHPAEVVIGTNQPFAGEIYRSFPQLPENVRVIEPAEKINSWTMAAVATAALVHTSTPGMELPIAGVPAIVVSRTHYRGKGFTVDIESKKEYFRTIAEWRGSPIPVERMKTLAMRYAWLLFERFHLPWDFLLETSNGRHWAMDVGHDEELAQNRTLARLCHCVETREDFLLDDERLPATENN